ncbi:hypothetical protein [Erythrobacter litoralis]|uniref:hypothetical protein n=1 Tax=Erythrobacter litoralis TaxID=39960 RepID=UPI0024355766|nr:hypothetical protein [Erythrobacter litoralis]
MKYASVPVRDKNADRDSFESGLEQQPHPIQFGATGIPLFGKDRYLLTQGIEFV